MYLRARNSKQIDERKKEIIAAMDNLYMNKELSNIYLKDIAASTHISRTAIYSYYKSKEEILLDSLYNHFISLDDELEKIISLEIKESEAINKITKLFEKNVIILKIMSTNLEDIERLSTLENLITLKSELKRFQEAFRGILKKYHPHADSSIINKSLYILITMLYGFYPIAYPIEVQKKAMEITNTYIDITLQNLIALSLQMIFNNLEKENAD